MPAIARAGLNSWTPATFPNNMNMTGLALSPAFPCDKTVFVITDGFGIYRTTQGDVPDPVWYPVNNRLTDMSITSMAISPNYNRCDRATFFNQGDNTVFVGTRSGLLYRSTDQGNSWNLANGGLPSRAAASNYSVAALGVSPNYSSDQTVFAGVQATMAGGPNAVYRSTDSGSVWLPFDAGLSDRTVQAFAISANFANDATLFLGTRFSGVYRFAGRLTAAAPPPPAAAPPSVASPTATPVLGPTAQPTAAPRTSGEERSRVADEISLPYPSIKLVATAGGAPDGQTTYSVPGPVVFTYKVTNNGNAIINNIRVIDGGKQDFCGDDPDTKDNNEAIDDLSVGTITSLSPGQSQTLTATILVRPANPAAGVETTFIPRRFAACAVGDSATGAVVSQDDTVVQLVLWNSITNTSSELSDLWIWSFAVSPFFANDQTVYAGSAYGGLFKSANAGTSTPTWTRVNRGLEQEWVSVRSIVLSPRYPNDKTMFIGTERGIYKGVENADGSVAWSALNKGLLRTDVRSLGISPNFYEDQIIFGAAWGNDIYRLTNATTDPTWVPQRRVINGLWAWTTAVTPDGVLLAGTWSGGPTWPGILARNVLNSGLGWQFPALPAASGGETTVITVSKTYCTGYTMFAGTWDRGMFKSDDGGNTWVVVPIPTSLPIRSISLSPNYAHDYTLYVATWGTGIYRSTDGGNSWGQLNAGLPDLMVRAVLISPTFASDGVVYAGTEAAGVVRWDPGQQRWVGSSAGLTINRIMSLAASPSFGADGTLAASTWGGGVAISRDRGATWTHSTAGLPSLFIRAVEFSPTYGAGDSAIYAGSTVGAFRSTNSGSTWALLGSTADDIYGVDVTGLAITAGSPRTLFISTAGRGLWQYTETGALAGAGQLRRVDAVSQLAADGLPNRTYVPIAPKNRQASIC